MYAVTSTPVDKRTRATFRRAELGFLGVMVFTTVQTPRFCGHPSMAGCFGLERCGIRGALISWLIVGIRYLDLSPRGDPFTFMRNRYLSKRLAHPPEGLGFFSDQDP
jgi:hypothetical protein